MKKILLVLFALPLLAGIDVTASGAMFVPKASYFRQAYGNTILVFCAEGEFKINPFIGAFLGADILKKDGKLTFSGEPVKLTIFPVNAGVRFHFLNFFVDGGIGSWNYSEKTDFASSSGSTTGFFVGAGMIYKFLKPFVRLRIKYSMAKKRLEDIESDLSGLQVELGVGMSF